jgi:hypothetical protein
VTFEVLVAVSVRNNILWDVIYTVWLKFTGYSEELKKKKDEEVNM